jgi:hypothetical protein
VLLCQNSCYLRPWWDVRPLASGIMKKNIFRSFENLLVCQTRVVGMRKNKFAKQKAWGRRACTQSFNFKFKFNKKYKIKKSPWNITKLIVCLFPSWFINFVSFSWSLFWSWDFVYMFPNMTTIRMPSFIILQNFQLHFFRITPKPQLYGCNFLEMDKQWAIVNGFSVWVSSCEPRLACPSYTCGKLLLNQNAGFLLG